MLSNTPKIKKNPLMDKDIIFNLLSDNDISRPINSEDICFIMSTHLTDAKVTLLLDVFGQEIEKLISLKNLQENIDNFFLKNVLRMVLVEFKYEDAYMAYRFKFSADSYDVHFDSIYEKR